MTKSKPFFSIVVPVYNTEPYLDELICSVRAQTFDDWELILVDDGSTDRSGLICDRWSNDADIVVYHTENNGGMPARYYGISRSRGEYVLVADADDRLLPGCLAAVKGVLEETPCDIVMFGFRSFGGESDICFPPLQPGKQYRKEEIIPAVAADEYYALWNKAVKGAIIRNHHFCDLEKLSMNHDVSMLYPILVGIKSGCFLHEVLYEYRVLGNSVSHGMTRTKVIDAGRSIGYAKDVLAKAGFFHGKTEEALFRTYAKQLFCLFDLVSGGKNQFEDFDPVREQPVYRDFAAFEKAGLIGIQRAVLLRLFRKRRYGTIRLLLKGKRLIGK